jgi:zinc protease
MKALRLFIVLIFAGFWQLASAQAFEIREVTSPGGIKAWLVSDSTIPMIAMNFSFRGGAASDPAGKQGRTYFLSGMLDEGAGELNSEAFPGTHERTGRADVLRRGKRIFFRLVPDPFQQQG